MRLILYSSIPFICAVIGYIGMASYMKVSEVTVPAVVGLPLSEALSRLSDMNLYGHIMVEQEDADIPVGTVLEQLPRSGHTMKMRQSVGLLVVKAPPKLYVPYCIGRSLEDIACEVQTLGIKLKIHDIHVNGTIGTCYAQYPAAGKESVDHVLHIYRNVPPAESYHLMADFRGKTLDMAKPIIASWGADVKVIHEDPSLFHDTSCASCVIKDQKPAPGEPIDKKKLHVVYVQVGR